MNLNSIKNFIRKCSNDNIAAFSAQSAFFIIISVFPLAIITMSVIKILYKEADLIFLLTTDFVPEWLGNIVYSYINEISFLSDGAIISLASLTLLYSASKGMLAVVYGISNISGEDRGQGFIALRIKAFIFTTAFILAITCVLGLLVFWNRLLDFLWHTTKNTTLLNIARIGFSVFFLTVIFTAVYVFSPSKRKSPLSQIPGAFICALGWMGFSYAYSFYIESTDKHIDIYGSISSPVLFMLWLYFCMYMLFLGAEVNGLLDFKLGKS